MGTYKLKTIATIALLLFAAAVSFATEAFHPLDDTLRQYQILKMPGAADYPDIPAVAILSLTEYRQLDAKHERRIHKIIKILTQAGKQYTTIKLPCLSTCRILARTIKPDGKIQNLPSRELVRTEKLTTYSSPYFLAQFAMPGVEPGDLIEYMATLEYPYPFLIDDFHFAEPLPALKAILVLTHPSDYAYSYVRYSPPGSSPIQVSRDSYVESQNQYSRTIFVVDHVRPAMIEPQSSGAVQGVPGLRIVIQNRMGRDYDIFKDWWSYGAFVAEQARVAPMLPGEIRNFVLESTEDKTDPAAMVRAVYQQADRRIRIVEETLPESGFEFEDPSETFKAKVATPHSFALFLTSCFRILRWSSDLILVNSHDKAEANKEAVFPLDLDLVYLNVKTPAGEILLDCNQNGMPANLISSDAMNRFAVGIPLLLESQFKAGEVYTTRTPYREGNKSHLELSAIPETGRWKLEFRWFLGGEFQTEFVRIYRQQGDAELRKAVVVFLRSRIRANDLSGMEYQFLQTGIELKGTGSVPRRTISGDLEMLQNEFWISDFEVRQSLLEGRVSPLLLPVAGEISSSYKIRIPEGTLLPASAQLECGPARYDLSFQKQARETQINEKLIIRDLQLRPANFVKFVEFLNQYYANHFWSILIPEPGRN